MFHNVLRPQLMNGYLQAANKIVQETVDQLPATGELDIFQHIKLLVHKVGFRCWAGEEAGGYYLSS